MKNFKFNFITDLYIKYPLAFRILLSLFIFIGYLLINSYINPVFAHSIGFLYDSPTRTKESFLRNAQMFIMEHQDFNDFSKECNRYLNRWKPLEWLHRTNEACIAEIISDLRDFYTGQKPQNKEIVERLNFFYSLTHPHPMWYYAKVALFLLPFILLVFFSGKEFNDVTDVSGSEGSDDSDSSNTSNE
jgi:hypothetical protein